jgi:type I restriction enzyme S subunit
MSGRTSIHHSFVDRHGIPAGWTERRLRELVEIVGGGTPDSSNPDFWDGNFPWLTPTEIGTRKSRTAVTSERKITALALHSSNCQLLPVGALVLSTRGTIGNAVIAGVPLTCNQSCEALLPREGVSSEYLYYLICYLQPLFERLGAGTTFRSITRRDIRDIRVSFPPAKEQEHISAILVAADEAVTAATAKLTCARRLKAALVQQLFTRGIPERHSHYKDSILGKIPEDWNVASIASVLDGLPFNGISPQSRPEPPGIPILNVECIDDGRCSLEKVTYVDVGTEDIEQYQAHVGDFYVLRGNGNRDYVATGGLLAMSPTEGAPDCVEPERNHR